MLKSVKKEKIIAANADKARSILFKNATLLTMDKDIGDFVKGDILIKERKIIDVGGDLSSAETDTNTLVVDATDRIIMPGLQDVHRHCWQGQLRRTQPDCENIGEYLAVYHDTFAKLYRPEDIYIGNLVCAIGCLESGITNVHDLMHNPRTSAHADASIEAFRDAGIRATHAECGVFSGGQGRQWPDDLKRLKDTYFTGDDNLLTLRIALMGSGSFSPDSISLSEERIDFARDLGIAITGEGVMGPGSDKNLIRLGKAGYLGPDIMLTHCNDICDESWKYIADSGTAIAMTPTSDALYGIFDGLTPIQKVMDLGIEAAGLGADTIVNLNDDLFAQMQGVAVIQRLVAFNKRYHENLTDVPAIGVNDIVELSTIRAAKATLDDKKCGSLTPGKDADLIVINACEANNFPLNSAYGTVVYGTSSNNVELVMVAGNVKKFNGEMIGFDMDAIRKRAEESRDYLYEKAGFEYDILNPIYIDVQNRDTQGGGEGAKG